jgi:phospholipase/carboxylesterase
MSITRRQFVRDVTLAVVSRRAASAYRHWPLIRGSEDGRITARPLAAPRDPLSPGLHTLSVTGDRATVVLIPSSIRPSQPAPLVLMLHGATESSAQSMDALRQAAERTGAIVVAPSSAGVTWDAIRGVFADDLTDIDQQLNRVFEHCAVDPSHVAIAGFSDGASYAVSLGLINGDLFTHCIAYSPGFIIPRPRHGHPRVFIAHGTRDTILPIDQCGRRIASELTASGYTVDFNTFDGPHMIRPEMVDRSMQWFIPATTWPGNR